MLTKTRHKVEIGPSDHGRPMSLKAFEFAKTVGGYHFELSRGFVTVSEVANFFHACVVTLIRNFFVVHQVVNPDIIYMILTGMDGKVLIPEWESERHPDIAVYLTKPKGKKDRTMWRTWIPELAVEVVSERSTDRDYVEKRQEYWTLGVKEYWIVDVKRQQVVVLRRGKQDWIETRLGPDDICTTKLLPGFKLECKPVFAVGVEEDE
jgi:Uma2 family endonuclease